MHPSNEKLQESPELREFSGKVFRTLKEVPSEALESAFQKTEVDPAVGLAISKLEVDPLEFEKSIYHGSAARIISQTSSGQRPCITPHYHKVGYDFVVFLKPTELHLGTLTSDDKGVEWSEPTTTNPGDELRLGVGQVHTWRSVEGSDSDFLFYCPDGHLIDYTLERPEGDRYIVKDLINGIPPEYKK